MQYISATDQEALAAFQLCSRLEGIIPALEPAHALAKVLDLAPQKPKDHLMVVNLSGRGDKDLDKVAEYLGSGSVTTRIDRRFAALKEEGRAALVTFLMAGDPDPDTALAIVKALPDAGADVIELGMPFTDPMADGPAIQAAGLRALHAGQTMVKTLALVRGFRAADDTTPIVLMGYYNPIYVYGVDRFLADAKAAGVDGLIVVDLPPEEDQELCLPALQAGLNFIRLATPTTDDKRLPAVLANTSGFVYYVSITGITGAATPDAARVTRSGRPHQAPHRSAGRCRLRRQDRRERARDRRPAPTAWWSARRWSRRCAASLDRDGKATSGNRRGGGRPRPRTCQRCAQRRPASRRIACTG